MRWVVIRAYRRGLRLGEQRARQADVEFLRAQADAHHGQVGDSRRRGAPALEVDALVRAEKPRWVLASQRPERTSR